MDPSPIRLLLVEHEPEMARWLEERLETPGAPRFELLQATDLAAAAELLTRRAFDAALLDTSSAEAGCRHAVERLLAAAPDLAVVMFCRGDADPEARDLVGEGALDLVQREEIGGASLGRAIELAVRSAGLARREVELARTEQRAQAAARDAIRSRDAVGGMVAHDLRNALSVINVTVAQLLADGRSDEQRVRYLQIIARASARMDRLIADVQDLVRLQSEGLTLEQVEVAGAELAEELERVLGTRASAAGVTLRMELDESFPSVSADRKRLVQALSNLVVNALGHTPAGGTVTVSGRELGDSAIFSVSDTGAGIRAEDVPRVFEPFWRGDRQSKEGLGLGLTIARGIVEAHEGRIWVASEPGAGSTFFFTIPLAPRRQPGQGLPRPRVEIEQRREPLTPLDDEDLPPLRVLIVDDHATLRRGLAHLLRPVAGIEVVGEAETGEEAIRKARSARPDVVLMDLTLPGMSGLEATRTITGELQSVRVLALTAEPEESALLAVLRAGGSGFVRKTTAHEDLVPALRALARDEVFLYSSGCGLLLRDYLAVRGADEGLLADLSEQEQRLLQLTAEGFTSAEIARKLFLSPATIDSYRSRLMRKLGLTSRTELVHFALRVGLLRAE